MALVADNLIEAPKLSEQLRKLTREFMDAKKSMTSYQFEQFRATFQKQNHCSAIGWNDTFPDLFFYTFSECVLFDGTVSDIKVLEEKKTKDFLLFKIPIVEKKLSISICTNKGDNYYLKSFCVEWDPSIAELNKGDRIIATGLVNAIVYSYDYSVIYSDAGKFVCEKQ